MKNKKWKPGKNKILVECETCKCHFYIPIKQIFRKKRKHRFCGRLCYYAFMTITSKNKPGEYFKKDKGRWFVYWRESGKKYIVPKARWLWEKENGPIPDGYDIHHKDEDKTNDIINNLELWESYEHREWHKFSEEVDKIIVYEETQT